MRPLGRLEKVKIQDVWPNEAYSFTPWLANEENICLLGDEIGMELEVHSQEERVGPYKADLLCKNTSNDHYVVIENQYNSTDHKHLGQLLTYASGLNAVTVIWISEKFTEEHRSALDWLNSKTDESVEFFGIEIELYRIGDSLPAPKFNIVSKPNDWSKTIKRNADAVLLTDAKKLQLEYWTALKEYCEKEKVPFKMQKPPAQHWTNIAIGRSYFTLLAFANTRDNRIGCQLIVAGPNALENFRQLRHLYEEQSKVEVAGNIEWEEKEGGKEHHVSIRYDRNPAHKRDWNAQHELLKSTLEKMYHFFRGKIKKL